jgi:hypothetical protein
MQTGSSRGRPTHHSRVRSLLARALLPLTKRADAPTDTAPPPSQVDSKDHLERVLRDLPCPVIGDRTQASVRLPLDHTRATTSQGPDVEQWIACVRSLAETESGLWKTWPDAQVPPRPASSHFQWPPFASVSSPSWSVSTPTSSS